MDLSDRLDVAKGLPILRGFLVALAQTVVCQAVVGSSLDRCSFSTPKDGSG